MVAMGANPKFNFFFFLMFFFFFFFPGKITGSWFVIDKHFGGPYRNPEKTLKDSKASEQISAVPTLSLFPGSKLLPSAFCSSLGFIWDVLMVFFFFLLSG